MLTANLINNSYTPAETPGYCGQGPQLISDFKLTHLPVVADNKFLALSVKTTCWMLMQKTRKGASSFYRNR